VTTRQRRAATSTAAARPEPRRNSDMTNPASGTSLLTAEQRERITALLGDVEAADDRLLMVLAQLTHDRRENEHPAWEDLSRHNAAGWMGDRTGLVLRRVLDLEAENARLRGEPTDLTPIPVHWDRLVMHPSGEDTDTVVCCKTDSGHPVALFLDDELREALGLQLVDPHPDEEATEATDTPDFFKPGRVYQLVRDVTWTFDVRSIEESPDGMRTALGFLAATNYGSDVWTPHGEHDFDVWTDVTDNQPKSETD
jgi:hypothetical protein